MATTRGTPTTAPRAIPVGPSVEAWRAMTAAERESFLVKVLDALSDQRNAMAEDKMAEPFGSTTQLGHLTRMVENLEAKADEAETKADEAEAKAKQALTGLQAGVLGVLAARAISCSNEERERVMSCDDPSTLQRWLLRALAAPSAAEALDG